MNKLTSKPPEVSVLMPVYNGETYLEEAIDSILNQTFSDFEFIIINDGSTDHSVEIIQSYNDARIKLINNLSNLGLEKTLNRGIQLAQGKYIARMDSDDISLQYRLETQVIFMNANPAVTLCGSWVETFGVRQDIWKYPTQHDDIRCHLLFESCFAHPSIIMRRSAVLKDEPLFDESQAYKHAEDYVLWTRLSEHHALANIPTVLLKYRQHDINLEYKHKNSQATVADSIREQQLKSFGIDFSPDELTLHCKIARWAFEPTLQFVEAAGAWLSKIAMTNKKSHYYDQDLLNIVLAMRWWRVCQQATSLGPTAIRRFKQHPLHPHASPPIKKLLIFTIKCLIKRGPK